MSSQTAAQRGAMGPRDMDGEPLSDMQREKLQEQLRSLTMGRDDISDIMVFALDHAEAAGEVGQAVILLSTCIYKLKYMHL